MGNHEGRWRPNVTVAAFIERDGRLLLVREHTSVGICLNNPAGHLEPGESPLQAVAREVLEETGHPFQAQALLGFYLSDQRTIEGQEVRFLRIAFVGTAGPRQHDQLDEGIIETLWLTPAELRARAAEHRSPLLLQGLDDYEAGRRFPLNLIRAPEDPL